MPPDVLYTITKQDRRREDYDLETEDLGFHCHECGWRNPTLPMNHDSDNILDSVCPECGSKGVENKLTSHIDEIIDIISREYVKEDEFVPYSYLREQFEPPQARLDEALNHLLSRNDAYVVFDGGRPLISVTRTRSRDD